MSQTGIDAQLRFEIIDAYNAYAEGIDSKDWALVLSCFADEVCIDYGEVHAAAGGPEVPRKAEAWLLSLQGVINGFDLTRHTITNHRFAMEGDCVVCRAYLTAEHVIFADPAIPAAAADEVATVVGEYTNTYQHTDDGWKIRKSKLHMNWSAGNADLFVVAMERAAQV